MEKNNDETASEKKRGNLLFLVIVVIVVFIAGVFLLSKLGKGEINRVYMAIFYDGSWDGYIQNGVRSGYSIEGWGMVDINEERSKILFPERIHNLVNSQYYNDVPKYYFLIIEKPDLNLFEKWIISIMIQKSNVYGKLYVVVWCERYDSNLQSEVIILGQESTSSSYGVVNVVCQVPS